MYVSHSIWDRKRFYHCMVRRWQYVCDKHLSARNSHASICCIAMWSDMACFCELWINSRVPYIYNDNRKPHSIWALFQLECHFLLLIYWKFTCCLCNDIEFSPNTDRIEYVRAQSNRITKHTHTHTHSHAHLQSLKFSNNHLNVIMASFCINNAT